VRHSIPGDQLVRAADPRLLGAFFTFAFVFGASGWHVGVGNSANPDSLAAVWSAGVARSHNSPSRIIPQRGKVKQDQAKSSSHKHRAVFHPHVPGSNFTNNARHLPP
jgi:hypothetical protein